MPTINKKAKTKNKTNESQREGCKSAISIGTFICIAIYTGITYFSYQTTHETFRATERPILSLKHVGPGGWSPKQFTDITAEFVNIGRASAQAIKCETWLAVPYVEKIIIPPKGKDIGTKSRCANDIIPPGQYYLHLIENRKQNLPQIMASGFLVQGRIQYGELNDVSNRTWWESLFYKPRFYCNSFSFAYDNVSHKFIISGTVPNLCDSNSHDLSYEGSHE